MLPSVLSRVVGECQRGTEGGRWKGKGERGTYCTLETFQTSHRHQRQNAEIKPPCHPQPANPEDIHPKEKSTPKSSEERKKETFVVPIKSHPTVSFIIRTTLHRSKTPNITVYISARTYQRNQEPTANASALHLPPSVFPHTKSTIPVCKSHRIQHRQSHSLVPPHPTTHNPPSSHHNRQRAKSSPIMAPRASTQA